MQGANGVKRGHTPRPCDLDLIKLGYDDEKIEKKDFVVVCLFECDGRIVRLLFG